MIEKERLQCYLSSLNLFKYEDINDFAISEYITFKTLYLSCSSISDRLYLTKYFMDNSSDELVLKISRTLNLNLSYGLANFKKKDKNCVYDLIIKEPKCKANHYLDFTYEESIDKLNQIILCNYIDDGYVPNELEITFLKRRIGVSFDNNDCTDIVETMYLNEHIEPDNLFFANDSNWCIECDEFFANNPRKIK